MRVPRLAGGIEEVLVGLEDAIGEIGLAQELPEVLDGVQLGRFKGALHAKKVVLTKAARMTRDIYYEALELQEGAKFEGGFRCTGGSASKPVTSSNRVRPPLPWMRTE